jgi:hypothetical protein
MLLGVAGGKVRVMRLATPRSTQRKPMHAGRSNLTLHEPVLHGLECADRAAECLALLNVLEREVDGALCGSGELCRKRDSPPLAQAGPSTRQPACGIDIRGLHEAPKRIGQHAVDPNDITCSDRDDGNILSKVYERGSGNREIPVSASQRTPRYESDRTGKLFVR